MNLESDKHTQLPFSWYGKYNATNARKYFGLFGKISINVITLKCRSVDDRVQNNQAEKKTADVT